MKNLGFVFTSPPHTTAKGREGLDALMATSAFSESIKVFFIDLGITQLLTNQNPELLLQKDYIPAFKLMEMYDIEDVYVSEESLQQFGVESEQLSIDCHVVNLPEIKSLLANCEKVLTF